MGKLAFLLVTAFLSIFGLIGGWTFLSQGKKIVGGCQAASWPNTTATLLSVGSKDTAESSSRKIIVRYEYFVDGQRYGGDTIHPALSVERIGGFIFIAGMGLLLLILSLFFGDWDV